MKPVQFGRVSIDLAKREASVADFPLKIGDRTFDVLELLVKAGSAVTPKSELARAVWPDQEVSDETVSQRISLLRKALKESGDNAPEVRNIHGRGYLLVDSGSAAETASSDKNFRWSAISRPAALVLLAASLILALGASMTLLWSDREAVRILVDREDGAVWMGRPDLGPEYPYPARAEVEGRRVFINSHMTVDDASLSPIGLAVYCSLATDRSQFVTPVPRDLSATLDKAKKSSFCAA